MNLLSLRKQYNLSQFEAASIAGISPRTYIRYELDDTYGDHLKRETIIDRIQKKCEITENKGVLTIEQITSIASQVFKEKYPDTVEFCYLFGSYAKGYANDKSDIDLCVSTSLTGLNFVGLAESLRQRLHKKIDLIRLSNLNNNIALVTEIMKDGIKIYG